MMSAPTKGAFVLVVLIYCCLAYTIAWGYSEEGTYRAKAKRPNVTMEEFCPGWGRPADWHIPPRTPSPDCCDWTNSQAKYYQTLCFKYGWIPPKGWVHPGNVSKGPGKGPHANMYDDYYYDNDYY